jgi:hypothetical protein
VLFVWGSTQAVVVWNADGGDDVVWDTMSLGKTKGWEGRSFEGSNLENLRIVLPRAEWG